MSSVSFANLGITFTRRALGGYESGANAIVLEKSAIPCIDVGGLLLGFVNQYTYLWSDAGSGWCIDGSYWRPDVANTGGFKAVGSYGRRGGNPTGNKFVVVLKDADSSGALAAPVDYAPIWKDQGTASNNDGAYWVPVPPAGYVALGAVAQTGYGKPSLDEVVCVREDRTTDAAIGSGIWIYGGIAETFRSY